MIWDALIIVASIILVCIDLFYQNNSTSFSSISKILRGIFRFLRIIILLRKVLFFLKK